MLYPRTGHIGSTTNLGMDSVRHMYYVHPRTLLHHTQHRSSKRKKSCVVKKKLGIDVPLKVTGKYHALDIASSIWSLDGNALPLEDTIKDAIFVMWEACHPNVGTKFFRQRSKWQRFVAFLFMVLDNARAGRRLDTCIRKCCCKWANMPRFAPIQSIASSLCVKSQWYTTRQVLFMASLDKISRTATASLNCTHCTEPVARL
jgi:hypothetical protein